MTTRESSHRGLTSVFSFLLFSLVFMALVLVKIPIAFDSFWAEDGAFYSQALVETFPSDFFISGGGYVIFVSRILSNLVANFPVYYAALANAVLLCFILGFLAQRIYKNLAFIVQNSTHRVMISLSILLLPINNFETIASGTSLHFILLFVTLIICLSASRTLNISIVDAVVVSVSFLSDPFTILCLTPLILGRTSQLRTFWRHRFSLLLLWGASFLIQGWMVYAIYSDTPRKLTDAPSLPKTIYLYFDRVVGSTLIPNWGLVSSNIFIDGRVTLFLVFRAFLAFVIFAVFFLVTTRIYGKSRRFGKDFDLHAILFLLLAPIAYWLIASFMINPEPRYAVLPGMSLLVIVVYLISQSFDLDGSIFKKKVYPGITSVLIVTLWLLSFSPSERRDSGVTWRSEVNKARLECQTDKLELATLKILPVDHGWSITIRCSTLWNLDN
jgi:hypothetical protein